MEVQNKTVFVVTVTRVGATVVDKAPVSALPPEVLAKLEAHCAEKGHEPPEQMVFIQAEDKLERLPLTWREGDLKFVPALPPEELQNGDILLDADYLASGPWQIPELIYRDKLDGSSLEFEVLIRVPYRKHGGEIDVGRLVEVRRRLPVTIHAAAA